MKSVFPVALINTSYLIFSTCKSPLQCIRCQIRPGSSSKIYCFPLKINARTMSASSEKRATSMSKTHSPSSFYSGSSLLELKNEKAESRSRIYEFLRSVGIVPNELDGLELPMTIEIMKERIDFLHSVGLTINDINNYPLVLGCSVKKNMIPVLDYLGKLGIRKSTFSVFLRRYPQVLHSSVVIDLIPVVNYLHGLDVKLVDIPTVLERYPDLFGFKLEGTMSTSVAYLIGIGVSRREIGGVITCFPELLGMRVGRVIKPLVEYLESLGLPKLAMARLIEKKPYILGFSLDDRVKPNVFALLNFGLKEASLSSVIAQYPDLLAVDLKEKLLYQQSFFESNMLLNSDEFVRIIERMPQIVVLGSEVMLRHVDFLKLCGLSQSQMRKMIVECPFLLALDMDVMKRSFEYFQMEMRRDLEDLVLFPAFFTYSLESTIKNRHRRVAEKGLKCSLAWMLACNDSKFEERMNYGFVRAEEMEMEPSSFIMNSLLRNRDEEEEDFDSEEGEFR